MSGQSDFEVLFNRPFDIDDEASLELGGEEAIIGDRDIRLLLRENRIALAKGKSNPVQNDDPDLAYYDVPLICIVNSHPECRFRWARLVIDLTPTKEARIRDMAPREVRGDKPVELKTSVGVGLKFETAANILGAEVKPEYTTSRTVYYPEIVSAGPGFTKGHWDFLALTNDFLHVNRELRLLVSAPVGIPVQARFTLRAKVKCVGVAGLIPVLSRSGTIDEIYRLD
jgi:hypothetical protein